MTLDPKIPQILDLRSEILDSQSQIPNPLLTNPIRMRYSHLTDSKTLDGQRPTAAATRPKTGGA